MLYWLQPADFDFESRSRSATPPAQQTEQQGKPPAQKKGSVAKPQLLMVKTLE